MTGYAAIAARLRSIAIKIGQPTNPRWIREQLDALAGELEEQHRATLCECGRPTTTSYCGDRCCSDCYRERVRDE